MGAKPDRVRLDESSMPLKLQRYGAFAVYYAQPQSTARLERIQASITIFGAARLPPAMPARTRSAISR